jgi:hypothetical protein
MPDDYPSGGQAGQALSGRKVPPEPLARKAGHLFKRAGFLEQGKKEISAREI